MPTVLLLRHGLTAMTGPVLAGRTPGVHLDERGTAQATAAADRLAVLPLAAVVTSPLERCAETARAVTRAQKAVGRTVRQRSDRRLLECDYGDWTGRSIETLAKDPLWPVVQQHPSAAVFPNGEAMSDMSARAVATVRRWDDKISAEHGPDALWLACSHGDVIKAILADALGLHLDQFQRIVADPASISVIRYTPIRPFVVRVNEGGDLASLVPPKAEAAASDAAVGGGGGG